MGEAFGNYEIIRRLAAGGMAEVLLAKQRSVGGFERLVCLKRILPHLSKQDDFLKMFQDEARIAANLIHPNIAQIYDISAEEGRYYIAMEYVRGEDLRRVYNQEVGRGSTIARPIAALVAMGAAAGLEYAHRQQDLDGQPLGIVHRDINPQNILITYDGFVKLIDFGVAKAAGKLLQTRSGVLKGKYSYMSPEQASGDPVDGRTDIFALGVTLYEITTGVRLFKRENELETLHAVIACNVTPPRELVPDYEPQLQAIILKALAYDPDDRYRCASDMQTDLEAYLLEGGHPTRANALATFMHDTFAEKLAEEAISGAPPWSEAVRQESPTHSRAVKQQRKRRRPQPPAAQPSVPAATAIEPTLEAVKKSTEAAPPQGFGWSVDEDGQEQTVSTMQPSPNLLPPGPAAGPPGGPHPTDQALAYPATAPYMDLPLNGARPTPRRTWTAWLLLGLCCSAAAYAYRRRQIPPAPKVAAARAASADPVPNPPVSPPQPEAEAAPARPPSLEVRAPFALELNLAGQDLSSTEAVHPVSKPGVYRLRAQNSAYGFSLQRWVRIHPTEPTQLDLSATQGHLRVDATPWAWVQVGEQTPSETPVSVDLLAGDYEVRVECADGRRRLQRLRVLPLQDVTAQIDCGNAPPPD